MMAIVTDSDDGCESSEPSLFFLDGSMYRNISNDIGF